MSREKKLVLADFVNGDRFELHSYLNYLLTEHHADLNHDQSYEGKLH
jgi:hypothetical protein